MIRNISGRGNSPGKGPEAEPCLVHWKKRLEASVAAAKGERGNGRE